MLSSNLRAMLPTAAAIAVAASIGAAPTDAGERVASSSAATSERMRETLREALGEMSDREMRDVIHARFRPFDEPFHPRDHKKEELGRLLFFDKILSGNMNISCATCHHPMAFTGDGLALPVGEGGMGLGITRNTGVGPDAIHERVPRNAPHLFNLGAQQFTTMFHDGRLRVDPTQPSGFLNPAGDDLPQGLDHVLAAQAMFPVTSAAEMAGQYGENPIADATHVGNLAGPGGVWERLADRIRPIYADLFIEAFDEIDTPEQITYVHAANAIGAFEAAQWRADDSPFDRWLDGDRQAMSPQQKRGMMLFYGRARCSDCHAGRFQTDHDFHAIAMPQIGPGKGDNLPGYTDGREDFGRGRETGDPADMFRFRTPTLRNVALTGPWGHSGAYDTLEGVVRHHLDPERALETYDASQALLPSRPDLDAIDFACHNDPVRRAAIAAACDLEPIRISTREFEDLIAFLHALTDRDSLDLRRDAPASVPSGLPIFD